MLPTVLAADKDKVTPAAAGSGSGSEPPKKKACCRKKDGKLYKPTELPLYGNPYPAKDRILNAEPGRLESQITVARRAVTAQLAPVGAFIDRSEQFIQTGIAHSQQSLTWMSEEANSAAKAGIIAGGGLLGMLLASRRGIFRKLIFTSAGLGLGAWGCYPKETRETLDVGLYIARNKGPTLVKDYTGIDPLADDVWGQIKRKMNSQSTSSTPPTIDKEELDRNLLNRDNIRNRDQSKAGDADLYANRSTK